MPELELEAFKYPDEKGEPEQLEIVIEDDTPEEDRNLAPMPKDIVEELDNDDRNNISSDSPKSEESRET